ncbi:hypothetical protein RFZ49_03965, partial [Acinetobacter baumannii]|nr:hypothetical protein [Acinetobacter baumannii]
EFNSTQQGLQSRVQTSLQSMNTTFETRVKQAAEQLRKENNLDFILNKPIVHCTIACNLNGSLRY